MARKLSDAEFTERTRAANRRRTERYQQRLVASGKTALTVWIPDTLKTALQTAALSSGSTIADTAALWLTAAAGLSSQPAMTTPRASNDAMADLFAPGEVIPTDTREKIGDGNISSLVSVADKDDRDQQILELHRQGLSNVKIGERLGCNEASVRRALKRLNRR